MGESQPLSESLSGVIYSAGMFVQTNVQMSSTIDATYKKIDHPHSFPFFLSPVFF